MSGRRPNRRGKGTSPADAPLESGSPAEEGAPSTSPDQNDGRPAIPAPRLPPKSTIPAESPIFTGKGASTSIRPDPKPAFPAARSVEEIREELERNAPPPERPTVAAVVRSPHRWWRIWVRRVFPGVPDYLVETLAVMALLIALAFPAAVVLLVRGAFREEEDLGIRAQSLPPDPRHLTSDAEAEALATIRAYLAADGWKAKLAHVRNPFETEPRMARWYADPRSAGQDGPRELGPVLLRKRENVAGRDIIVLAVEVLPEASRRIFLVERISETLYKIDWESSEGYQEMRLEDFQSTLPSEAKPFRVHARRSDYYNFGFDAERHESFQLYYPNDPEFRLFAYAPRDGPVAGDLAVHLPKESASTASLILDLAYPAEDARPEQALITRLRQSHWIED